MPTKKLLSVRVMKLPNYNRSDYGNILVCTLFVVFGVVASEEGGLHWATYFFGVCLIVALFSPVLKNHIERVKAAQQEFVEFDSVRIKRYVPKKIEESILWSEIGKISIFTNDKGPFFDDLHWVISGIDESKGVIISNDAEGLPKLLEQFQKLPLFDGEKVVEAMGCAENASFVLWQRNT